MCIYVPYSFTHWPCSVSKIYYYQGVFIRQYNLLPAITRW